MGCLCPERGADTLWVPVLWVYWSGKGLLVVPLSQNEYRRKGAPEIGSPIICVYCFIDENF